MSAEGRGEDAQKEDASTGKLRECDVDKEDNNVKHFETHADVICTMAPYEILSCR